MELKFPMSEEEVQCYLAESAAALARKPVKSRHALVTLGSKTEHGGEVVTANTGIKIVANGDKLVESGQTRHRLTQFADEPPIPGLLQPGYVLPTRSEVRR